MKRWTILAVLAASLLGVTTQTATTATASAAAARSSTSSFPVTVTASNGPVTITARPTRIMSLSASATSMIYDIGAGHQVVAVDKYSTDPPKAPRTALTGFETGAESYVSYHPDLIVLAQNQGSLASQLVGLRIPTLILPAANTLSDTYAQIALLGKATGHAAGARAENASITSKLAAIVRSVGSRARGVTYYQEIDPTLYTATSDTFIGALYKSLGMVNIADGAIPSGNQYPQLSAEVLVKANPDIVILADHTCCGQTPASFAKRPGFSMLRAVRLHHVYVIPDAIASEWGPRIVTFLQMLAKDVTSAHPRPTS